ncbi:MAG TPA: extracellular solute-binding protein [Chloroflexota bacterium]|nr:extracellular solute-binding protein [Chloroflexota bacterium]
MAAWNGLSRRRVLAGGALGSGALAAGGVVAACGPAAGTPSDQASRLNRTPVTLRLKTWTNVINLPVWEQALKQFNDAHAADKITLVLEHQPNDNNAYWDKFTAEYASGDPPDVIYASPPELQSVARKGMVRDLSPEIKADKFNLGDINPPAQLPYLFDGKTWALACWNDTRVLSINKSAFTAAGIPLPPESWESPGWTTDDLLNAARKLNDPANGKFAIIPEGVGALKRLPWLFGAYFWNDDKVPTRSAFGSGENVTGLQWVRDLQYAHRVMAPREYAGSTGPVGGWEKAFIAGQAPIVWCAYKHVTAGWNSITDFEWSIAPLPRAKQRLAHVSPQAFATVSATKHAPEAWVVVKEYSTGEANAIMATVSSMPSYRKTDVYKVAAVPSERRWMVKLLQDAMNSGKPEVPHPNVKLEMLQAMDAVTTDLLDDKISAQEAAKSGAERVNALFEQFGVTTR